MIELKKLFNGRKAKIVSDLLNFHEFKLNLDNRMHPMFQNAIKKYLVVLENSMFLFNINKN
jgi:hypothetical protein